MTMNERIVRYDVATGDCDIIALSVAISELSGRHLHSELAWRLRDGEAVAMADGRCYRALSALSDEGADQLPPGAVS
jgi:hypothetical protein